MKRVVTREEALSDQKWIPVSINGQKIETSVDDAFREVEKAPEGSEVEESFGLPLAGYFAFGIAAAVAFIAVQGFLELL